jgi:hypothetical protein
MGFALNRRMNRLMTPTGRVLRVGDFLSTPAGRFRGFLFAQRKLASLHLVRVRNAKLPIQRTARSRRETMSRLLILADIPANGPALHVVHAESEFDTVARAKRPRMNRMAIRSPLHYAPASAWISFTCGDVV